MIGVNKWDALLICSVIKEEGIVELKSVTVAICDGTPDSSGDIFDRESFKPFDERVRVTRNFDQSQVIGSARLRWEGDRIMADLDLDDGVLLTGLTPAIGGQVDDREKEESGDRLRGVTVTGVALSDSANSDGRIGTLDGSAPRKPAIPALPAAPIQVPSVGRIVHYQSYGSPGGEYKPEPRAAVVTEVDENNLPIVLEDGSITFRPIGLCVLNPTGMFFNRNVPYSATPKPGHWNWPPRV